MNFRKLSATVLNANLVCLGLFIILNASRSSIHAQNGNSISGIIFGVQRQPVSDVEVELQDEFSRSINRLRTTGSGRYIFNGLRSGRYRIIVFPLGTGYEEQSQEYEIVNITARSQSGNVRTLGYDNAQLDIYLRVRKSQGGSDKNVGTVFVQEIPNRAEEKYKKAVNVLENNSEKAVTYLKEAIDIFPDYYSALKVLGNEYIRLKQFEQARDILNKAVVINPRSYNSWHNLAKAQFSLKSFADAVKAATKSVELAPNSINALLLLGIALKESGKYEDAEKELKRANDLAKGSIAEVHWQLAKLYADKLKKFREAADELELFLKLDANNANSENIKKLIKSFRDKANLKQKT